MEIQPIHNEEDYQTALDELETVFNAETGTPEGDKAEILSALIKVYEDEHYKIPLPDPIKAIEFHMERLGLTRKDLEPFIGNRARVSEIMNKKRPLSIRMIRNLNKGLGISTEILIQAYPTNSDIDADEEISNFKTGVLFIPWKDPIIETSRFLVTSQSGNELKDLLFSKGVKSKFLLSNRNITNPEASNQCIIAIPVPNWPSHTTTNCETDQPNLAGNSRVKRITP